MGLKFDHTTTANRIFWENVKWAYSPDLIFGASDLFSNCLLDIPPRLLNRHLKINTHENSQRQFSLSLSPLKAAPPPCPAQSTAPPVPQMLGSEAALCLALHIHPSQSRRILSLGSGSDLSTSLHPHHQHPSLSRLHHSPGLLHLTPKQAILPATARVVFRNLSKIEIQLSSGHLDNFLSYLG